jgi:hypothetical protein
MSAVVTKGKCEKWTIRDENGYWVGWFYFDTVRGDLAIQSDYGDWAYSWNAMGKNEDGSPSTLHDFLPMCDDDYVMTKFQGGEYYFDFDATMKEVKKTIIKERKEYNLDEDEARSMWDFFVELDSNFNGSKDIFQLEIMNNYSDLNLDKLWPDMCDIPCVTDYHPRLRNFFKVGWPLFIKALKEDKNDQKISVCRDLLR